MSELFTGMRIGNDMDIDGQKYSLVGMVDNTIMFGFPMNGQFIRQRCDYCGSMTDIADNCKHCGAPLQEERIDK